VRLAARGAREAANGGVVAVEDAEEAEQLRRQAARVYRESGAIALLVTGVTMLARSISGA
jgi:hypothetical protein